MSKEESWGQIYYGQPYFPVVCIKNTWINVKAGWGKLGDRDYPFLTVGKTYIVETDHRFNHELDKESARQYIITADDGQCHSMNPDLFVDLREKKLKRILDES